MKRQRAIKILRGACLSRQFITNLMVVKDAFGEGNVSRYADVSPIECFAECFNEYICSPKPRKMASWYGERIDKFFGKTARTVEKSGESGIIKMDKQFGKKIGKHAFDYGLDPASPDTREQMHKIIDAIYQAPDAIAHGDWRGQANPVKFFIKGDDVVITTENSVFVTILKEGISNARVKNARRE